MTNVGQSLHVVVLGPQSACVLRTNRVSRSSIRRYPTTLTHTRHMRPYPLVGADLTYAYTHPGRAGVRVHVREGHALGLAAHMRRVHAREGGDSHGH